MTSTRLGTTTTALVLLAALLAIIQLACGQNAAPGQQQPEDPNCPVARARAAMAKIRNEMAQMRQNAKDPLDQMAKNIAAQRSTLSQRAASASAANLPPMASNSNSLLSNSNKNSPLDAMTKPLVRNRRQVNPMQQQPNGNYMPVQPSQQQQQQSLVPTNNAGLNPQQQQQLQQQSNRLQMLMQSIQYNVTPDQMQQIIVTLIMIMVTLFTGPGSAGPSIAIMQTILKQVLPVIVNALMQMSGSFNSAPNAVAPQVAAVNAGW